MGSHHPYDFSCEICESVVPPYHITCTIYVIWYGITYSFNITLIYLAGLIW